MEITVPLVVGGLAGLSVATACGAEPRVPQVPPAELARQALETVAEKLPRELVENDLLKKIARSWASLAPAHRLGLVIEDASGRLAFLLLSSGVCCVLLTMVSLSPLGFALGLVAPFTVGAARDGFESRREQHDAEEAMPEAFTALSMSLASGHSLAQGMRFVGAHAQEPVHTEFLRVAAAIDCGISATDALDDLLVRIDAPGLSLVTLALKVSQRTGAPLADLLSEASSMVGERIELKRRLDVKTSQARMSAHMVAAMPAACARCWRCFRQIFVAVLRRPPARALWCWVLPSTPLPWWLSGALCGWSYERPGCSCGLPVRPECICRDGFGSGGCTQDRRGLQARGGAGRCRRSLGGRCSDRASEGRGWSGRPGASVARRSFRDDRCCALGSFGRSFV